MQNYQKTFRALGSETVLTVVAQSQTEAELVFVKLIDYITAFEERFSRFKVTSELSSVNAAAGEKTTVSGEFMALLKVSIELSRETEGLFNPFILPKLQEAGYRDSWQEADKKGEAPVYEGRAMATVENFELGGDWVRLPSNTALDFGGIGKGYLLARLVESVPPTQAGYWFSLGGDIAMGGHDVAGKAWEIGVAHALAAERRVGKFINDKGRGLAVATSGVTKRKGIRDGKAWHHLIDPRSGEPAETDLLTVTVSSDDPVRADVLAKCAVIIGSKTAWEFLEAHGVKETILQRMSDNEIEVIHKGNAQ
jgi:thiamine biosynthesis lipoprotein